MCPEKTEFQLTKVINKDHNSDNDGNGSNDDKNVKDYGDSYSDHHKI